MARQSNTGDADGCPFDRTGQIVPNDLPRPSAARFWLPTCLIGIGLMLLPVLLAAGALAYIVIKVLWINAGTQG